METRFLDLFLRFSGYVFALKNKLVRTNGWRKALPTAILLILAEVAFIIISIPLFFVVSPKKVQETGRFYPRKVPEHVQNYAVRRKITLATTLGAAGIFCVKVLFVGIVSFYLLGAQPLLADTQNWGFDVSGDYTYDSAKIEVTGGVAQLKDTGSTASGSTTNSGFDAGSTGWTYADWDQGGGEENIVGAYVGSAGNPGGWLRINVPAGKDDEFGGYWRQAFTTTVANPTVTVSFDYQVTAYDSSPAPVTLKLFVMADTGSGVPVIGQEIWSSGEITATQGWTSVTNIDASSKITTAGTYYFKLAIWIETPGSNTGPFTVGFDNALLSWTKTTHVYASDKPTIYPNASLNPAKVITWDSFAETATKNGGEIYYQLSDDNGSTWKYWNGSAWAVAGATNYNAASVVNANIATFPTVNNQVKWKAFLESNGTQQVILENVAVGYTQNSLPVIANLVPAQNSEAGYVHVNYDLQDNNSDPNSLVTYEYSLTGAFAGEQVTMTPVPADPAHSGVTGLATSPGGTPHTFVWDALSQVGAIYDSTVYVRLRANDGIGNGAYAVSSAFPIDYVVPVVSNVTASQTAGTTDVVFTYDLTDNTSTDALVELDISEDGGATWAVVDTSVTGAVGTGVSTGVGKTVTWVAKTDFSDQVQADIQVRIRAKDAWQNQGTDASSANFALDTLSPATATAANLKAQPNAGDTTVLIGGSFTETNPNTNDFYVALNNGAYSTATAGTVNTAVPADQNTAVGATLDGNDVISGVKIMHTDDFGQASDNENLSPSTSYKYVKPYTPLAPTLSAPATTNLNLTINPHASEAGDVQYTILETTTNQFVQSNGTLGASPAWLASGVINVNGLSSPLSLYVFKVKSRNPNDAAHAASSESAYSATAQITNTAPSVAYAGVSQTTDGTQYVSVQYTGTDGQGDVCSLPTYEYSTDNLNWYAMTEKAGVGSEGTSNLIFLSGGSARTFVWDSATDLPNSEHAATRVRLKPNDSLIDGSLVTSSPFAVDQKVPLVSNVTASQNSGARTVTIGYDLSDAHNSLVEIDVSEDGGATWTVADTAVSGDVGSGIAPGTGKTITWNAGADFDDQYQGDIRVRVRAMDTFGNQGTNVESSNFTLDTHDPVVTNVTAAQDSAAKTFIFNYDVSEDAGNTNVTLVISSNGGSTWVVPTTSAAGDFGAGIVSGSGKTITWNAGTDYDSFEKTAMRIRITATDAFSNAGIVSSSDFALDTLSPRVTGVSAVQTAGSTNVAITFTLADQNVSLVELDISDDAGASWTVVDASVSGDVGAGIGGGSKTITWAAGTDFDEQAQADMRVRVRAKDIFENQSANDESANFSLDTVNPVVAVGADLKAQPNAGDATVLIGGSFVETNPNANDFSLALNGGDYGASTAGQANTASPADQATAVGSTLDGNDYVSRVKIVHTDDFGQTVTNENAAPAVAYQYVKPYTPLAPTVDNPTVGTVDVTVNKHGSETDGLEYAIQETSQSKYVQSNGTLGDGIVWQALGTGSGQWGNGTGTPGKVTVSGLANHSYTYQFKTVSRNVSDAAHAASSESAYSGGASSANQSPAIAFGSIAQTTDDTEYVTINYTGSDLESENSNVITAEYSTNNSNWFGMTEKSGVGSDGTAGLAFAYTGTAHDFMWDVNADLANTEDSTVYVRLQANDGTSSGAITTSGAFTVDTKNPVVSAVTASQTLSSGNVSITYTLTDLSNGTVELDVSDDGGATWTVTDASVTGDVGGNVAPGAGKTIVWNALADFANQEQTDLRVRVRATDAFGNAGTNASSANFVLDTKSPVVSNVTASQDAGLNTVTIQYDLADAHDANVVVEISEDFGSTWGVATSTLSGDIGADIVPGAGKTVAWNAAADFPNRDQAGMMVRVRATDTYANVSANADSASFVVDTLAPAVSNVAASQTLGSESVTFTYDLVDSDFVEVEIDISDDGGATWAVADTSVTGAVGAGVAAGNGKTIVWDAGTDAPDFDVSTMRVRVRGTDSFENSSPNVESSNFLLDTLAPTADVSTDVTAQPHAGDTTVTISGSFTETNPNANDFSVAVNGGAYSGTTSGDANTAAPAPKATGIGATLDGNDYVSGAKITHADDYGHSVVNETTVIAVAKKYVKPYVPQAPGVSNPQNTSVDVDVVPNVSETAGLEYAIYEITTDSYVQTDGTLGPAADWLQDAAWGTVTVTGLSSPVAQYQFQVKSRNVSDGSHAATSESDLSVVGAVANTAPSISVISASQTVGSNYAVVAYAGTDAQNDTNDLTAFEYSTDNANWHVMTEKAGVGSDGISDLVFASAGTSYAFAWDIAVDLPNTGDSTVYARLQSTDGLAGSNLATSSAFAIDTLGPVVSNIRTSQAPDSSILTIRYDLVDDTAGGNDLTLEMSNDAGSTWTVPVTTLSGDVGSGVSAGANRTVTWGAGTDFAGQENASMRVRIQGTDAYANVGSVAESADFTADAKAAVVSGVSASQTAGTNAVRVDYSLSDLSSAGLLVEFGVSSDGGSSWTVATPTSSGDIGAGQTTGSRSFVWNAGTDFGNRYEADMRVRVRARDYFGNQGSYVESSDFSADTKDAVVSNVSGVQSPGSTDVTFAYDLTDDSATNLSVELDVSDDNGATWTVTDTGVTGNVGFGQTAGLGKTIIWAADLDFDGQQQSDMKVRIRATDGFSNQGEYSSSDPFTIDTANPAISNVQAAQDLDSEIVTFTYDLSDGTTVGLLVELDISNDNGVSWAVADTSVTGNIGAGQSVGAGNAVSWDAGADFPNQDVSDMMVRFRAADAFLNVGDFALSSSFGTDTKDPIVLALADLESQPHAGDAGVLVGGSFTETNPSENNLYVALNGGAYGSASVGLGSASVLTNQIVDAETTFQGDDYVSMVKIVETDKYGHVALNENAAPSEAFKYVKPYTPSPVTLENATATTVDLTVNRNPAEVSGLEYAILEQATGKYVQADGTLGTDAVWQTGAAWSTITVTGLAAPASGAVFATKSRNPSDAAHALTSESAFSSGASFDNSEPVVSISSVGQVAGQNYVVVQYTGTDLENNAVNLVTVEYSLDQVIWSAMTEKAGVGSDGTSGLPFSTAGTAFTFAWDAAADLSNLEDDSVYVRLSANDGIADGNVAVSPGFPLDLKSPIVSSVTAFQVAGSTDVTFTYDLSDLSPSDLTVELDVSDDDGATWNVAHSSLTGDIGVGQAVAADKTVIWAADTDFDGQYQTDMKVRVRALDAFGNQGAYAESLAFELDTANPIVGNVTASQDFGSRLVTIAYDLTGDNANNLEVVAELSDDGGVTWAVPTSSFSGSVGLGQTAGLEKTIMWDAATDFDGQYQNDLVVRVRAIDSFGNQGNTAASSAFSVDSLAPVVANVTATQDAGTSDVTVSYDLSDSGSVNPTTVELDVSDDNGATWTITDASMTGSVGAGQLPGNGKTIVWNAGNDFANQYRTNMRVRVRAVDRFGNQGIDVESSAYGLDTKPPEISNVSASQDPGTDSVTISYDLSDDAPAGLGIGLEISDDGGVTWTVSSASATGDVGFGLATGIGRTIVWNAGTDMSGQDFANMRVRLVATDGFGNVSEAFDSADFSVDTAYPTGLANLSQFSSTDTTVTLAWTAAADMTFDHYELWYGASQSDVQNRTGSASEWTTTDDASLGSAATDSTVIAGLDPESNLFVKIWAVDGFGHESTIADIGANTLARVTSGGGVGVPDFSAPGKPILHPAVTPTNQTSVTISGLAEPLAYLDFYDNGIFISRLTQTSNYQGGFSQEYEFGEGEHELTVRAIDPDGNASEPSDAFLLTVDLTPPEAPVISNQNNAEITSITPIVLGTAEALASVEITVDDANTFEVSADALGNWLHLLSNLFALDIGAHTFAVRAIDTAGNVSDPSVLVLNVIEILVPVAPQPETGGGAGMTGIPSVLPSETGTGVIPGGVGVVLPGLITLPEILPIVTPPVSIADIIKEEAEAVALPSLPRPEVILTAASIGGDQFVFSGTAVPNSDVAVYIHSQALVYQSKADATGAWSVTHSQGDAELASGDHTIYAVSIDPEAGVKSEPGPIKAFTVEKNLWATLYRYLNFQSTVAAVIVLLACVWWLVRLKKREAALRV